jgi:hypothetical protein
MSEGNQGRHPPTSRKQRTTAFWDARNRSSARPVSFRLSSSKAIGMASRGDPAALRTVWDGLLELLATQCH